MHIYLKNNQTKFYPSPVWNEGVLGFYEEHHPNNKRKKNNKMSSDMGLVPGPETTKNTGDVQISFEII